MGVRIWGKTPGAWTWRSRPDWRGPTVGPSALSASRKQEQKAVAIQASRVWRMYGRSANPAWKGREGEQCLCWGRLALPRILSLQAIRSAVPRAGKE